MAESAPTGATQAIGDVRQLAVDRCRVADAAARRPSSAVDARSRSLPGITDIARL